MFWKLRALTFYTVICIIGIILFIILYVPITLFNISYSFKYKIAEIFSCTFIYLLWDICGIKFQIDGLSKIPTNSKPYVVLSNHQSFWENFFMQVIIPKHSWVIKRELFDIPLFGMGLKMLNPIAIDRAQSSSVAQILRDGQEKINSGLNIIIFPEATRIKIDQTVAFKTSAAKLALNAKTPIVLMAHNAGMFWPKGFWFIKSGTIKVQIIDYMRYEAISQYDARQLTKIIQEKINNEKNRLVNC